MEEAFPRRNRISASKPWLLLSLSPATTPPPPHTHTHTHSHILFGAPKPIPGAPTLSYLGSVFIPPGFPLGPALRQQHGHHDLCRSLSVLSFIGSSYCPPLPLLSAPTSAFSIPLDIKFGGIFLYFRGFLYSYLPLLPATLPLSVLTWK